MAKKRKVNYNIKELRESFKKIYIDGDELYAVKDNILKDSTKVYVFKNDTEYVNKPKVWFDAQELKEA